ncbi:MAG: hydantoinase B/oxoprolinase family protein [Planctomycetota bacterium]
MRHTAAMVEAQGDGRRVAGKRGNAGSYRVGVDTGGTFTDVVLCAPDGVMVATHKLPSTPSDPSVAVLSGIEALLGKYAAASGVTLSREDVEVVHGSTVATNALIEMVQRQDAGVVLVTTAGFEDVLFLGRQHRPDLYALVPRRAGVPVLRERCVGVVERMAFDGEVLEALAEDEVERVVERVVALKPSAVALCLLHAYANGAHEARLAAALRDALPGEVGVTVSGELLPVRREFERAACCVVNAAVGPAMRGYLGRLDAALGAGLSVMGSHGGTMSVGEAVREPVRTMLSGPAGGVAGVRGVVGDALEELGGETLAGLITLDMGGTSTDVCLIDVSGGSSVGAAGGATLSTDHEAAGLPVAMPMVDVHAIGAGGGSIAWVDGGGALRVGPRSAGAEPGPAAYGKQGRTRGGRGRDALACDGWWPTVTDAHVVLGHVDVASGVGGLTLNGDEARAAIAALADRLSVSAEDAARGVIDVADAAMARAVQRVSLARGHDPRDFALVAFGGAGGLHACGVAARLGMTRVLVPASPGLMCAAGMLSAPRRRTAERTVGYAVEAGAMPEVRVKTAAKLRETHAALMRACGSSSAEASVRLTLDARYADQTHTLEVDAAAVLDRACAHDALREAFHAEHRRRFGWMLRERAVVWSASRCVADVQTATGPGYTHHNTRRAGFTTGDTFLGPLTVTETDATTRVPAGWSGRVASGGTLCLEAEGQASDLVSSEARNEVSPTADVSPIELEVFQQLYAAAAEEMGETLMRCASSPNITERLDYSCAVFDAEGAMVAQAAHIPVHLGSAPASVRAVITVFPTEGPQAMRRGDRFFLNDPFAGGTHLPDVTVVAPVFFGSEQRPVFFVAARAHHADVGGREPGSMGLSTRIEEEGVRFGPTRWSDDAVRRFADGSRTPAERHADLLAQAAAVDSGVERLMRLADANGTSRLLAAAAALLEHARRLTAEPLAALPAGRFTYEDVLDDDGLPSDRDGPTNIGIRCTLTVECGALPVFDFSDCDDQVAGPMNATRSIVESAVLYSLRLALGTELPSNSGVLDAVRIVTRPGSVVDAKPPAAVAGGNVETSQRLVDVILGLLDQAMPGRLPADSCGSMNNVVIGSCDVDQDRFAYYETLAGGAGAGPGLPGGDAIHTHMTNTRNTPVEALEARFPLRITRYLLRQDSGGAGQARGGLGVVRDYLFLRDARLTLLLERRRLGPSGRGGGGRGATGTQRLRRASGEVIELPGKCAIDIQAGDTLELETPGGAGYGLAE